MNRWIIASAVLFFAFLAAACGDQAGDEIYNGPNPFLQYQGEWLDDSGYINLEGRELHVTLEADVQASAEWMILRAPPELAQYAVTYLKKHHEFYLEILAEDATAPNRVEWLVDGEWLTRDQAGEVDRGKLRHFRMKQVNAVVLNSDYSNIRAGQVYQAKVPVTPDSIMMDAEDKCADYDSHIDLGQSVYWYLWNPDRSGCPAELVQSMTVTVDELLPDNPESYPEYDKLWEDKKLTAAVFWGKADEGDVKDDYNWGPFRQLRRWLEEAGFDCRTEDPPEGELPQMVRYTKTIGELSEVVDIYGPNMFHNVADYSRLHVWQQAVSDHEIVMYNGHSILGTGMAFERVNYPDFYQIFQVASCLSYEYYVRPVLNGKGSWDTVDIVSNTNPTYYNENLPLTSTILAKLFWGFENQGRASWQDIMEAVSARLYHNRFGVSGARGNRFRPDNNQPDRLRYSNDTRTEIPDDDANGISSNIQVPGQVEIQELSVEIDITHTYVGDLKLVLSHDGVSHTLWNREGDSADDIRRTFSTSAFNGQPAGGTWTLNVSDRAARDLGALQSWTLVITPSGGDYPDPESKRFENTSRSEIPDNDERGVISEIEINESLTIGSLEVELDVTHSYIGDLSIVLSHDGIEYAVWDQSGGGSDDIRQTFRPGVFDGQDARGTWRLHLVDHMNLDQGALNDWALAIQPAR